MHEVFPNQPYFGDMFNGTLIRAIVRIQNRFLDKGVDIRSVCSIREFPYENDVRTLMGWVDLSCLNYEELRQGDGRRYRFEIVREDYMGRIICRALEKTNDLRLDYQSPSETELRKELEYSVGQERVVIPGKVDFKDRTKLPRGVFFDLYFPEMTGIIFFDDNGLRIKPFLGKRLLVRVNKVLAPKQKGSNSLVFSEFLRQE